MKNDVPNVRRVLGDGVDHRIAKLFAARLPIAILQIVRRKLSEERRRKAA